MFCKMAFIPVVARSDRVFFENVNFFQFFHFSGFWNSFFSGNFPHFKVFFNFHSNIIHYVVLGCFVLLCLFIGISNIYPMAFSSRLSAESADLGAESRRARCLRNRGRHGVRGRHRKDTRIMIVC